MQLLQRPFGVVHEPMREPVEQFRMRWRGTHEAEVVRGGHEALAEVLLPDTIHDHAGGKRVVVACNPLCEAEAALRGLFTRWELRLLFDEDSWHRRLDEIAESCG